MRRRDFISAFGLGSCSFIAHAGSLAAPQPDSLAQADREGGKRRAKVGAVSWNFHSLAPGAHPEEAIDIIGSLGFEGVELIANSRQDIDEYWTDATVDRIKKQLERNRLELNQFPFFQPVVEGLTSRDAEERKHSLDYFERGCRIAKKLGAPMVNIVAPWARELRAFTEYLPRYFMSDSKPGEKFHIDIAPGFNWEELWSLFIGTMKTCVELAKAHGLRFSIENHTHTMLPITDCFLRLWGRHSRPGPRLQPRLWLGHEPARVSSHRHPQAEPASHESSSARHRRPDAGICGRGRGGHGL